MAFAQQLRHRLGAGERACIAVAYHREGLFASDDLDARRQAEAHGIHTTGTVGILALNVRLERLTLAEGNELLLQLVNLGYRSPVAILDNHV